MARKNYISTFRRNRISSISSAVAGIGGMIIAEFKSWDSIANNCEKIELTWEQL